MMLQTLFHIPHQWGDLTVFGAGWMLIAWLLISAAILLWLARRQGWGHDTLSYLPIFAIVALAIWLLLPRLEETLPDGTVLGLPIRGYGTMMLVGVVSGVLLAAYRARRLGLDPERIYALAFWMFIAGIAGARLFFVIQYWPSFQKENLFLTLGEIFKFTEGGLVVYGAVIGGLAAGALFVYRRQLPLLAMGDLIAPGMLLGLMFGRIGCLLNGCCFGGVCDDCQAAIRFPASSPPYMHQLQNGQLLGMRLSQLPASRELLVEGVEPDSPAAAKGVEAGQRVVALATTEQLKMALRHPDVPQAVLTLERLPGAAEPLRWTVRDLPQHSRPVHPTQIYSAVNAGLICLLLLAYFPMRRRDGEVFALMVTIYPITRMLLEIIRNDEPGRFGTQLTISQMLSVCLLIAAGALWIYILRRPRGSALPPANPQTAGRG